ncbi:LysR family transcriptional regulator [Pseudomonas entomophila]|jgi:DNA-binding transcriptional LysR family regulator|uniref:LysR family transcriptional regulator n=1 Tax=Pseudomonas entomophila TaxID=312306 RepID=UPI0015E273C5|nr:LysR family transcriptional regulator [Pseudomonas entomophila]MBA1193368.1 LysR family transcriptional regulator [Pseudomonas entomophila]
MIRFNDLEIFVRSAALGSFTAAALEAGLLPGQAAEAVKRLERELDVRLFARTTRSLRLTAEGEQYLPSALTALEALQRGRDDLRRDPAQLQGTLQLSAPSDLGRNLLLPWLTDFRREHPLLHLRFLLSDQRVDLFRDPVDIAIRYGLDVDASYVALPLAPRNRKVLVASPHYLARHGQPHAPEDLRDHQCLLYMQQGRLYDKWRLGAETVQVGGTLLSDDADVARRWAVAGEGITYKSWLDVSDDVLAGRLVLLMSDHPGPALPLSLVCPHRKQLSPTVTRLHAWLSERFAGLPGPDDATSSTRQPGHVDAFAQHTPHRRGCAGQKDR